MSSDLEKVDSLFDKLRRFFYEQLWLILLLAPLLVIITLIWTHAQSNKKQIVNVSNSITGSSSRAVFAVSVEISSAELVAIVAKPLGELLAMEVYLDNKQKNRNSTRLSSFELSEDIRNEAYNKSLTNHSASYVLVGEPIKDRTNG